MVCGGEARCQEGREVGIGEIEKDGTKAKKKEKEKGNANGPIRRLREGTKET